MLEFPRIFGKVAPSLVAVAVLLLAVPVSAASAAPGALLLAQSAEPAEKAAAEAKRLEQEKKARQEREMEKSMKQEEKIPTSSPRAIPEAPAASGTKKMGGQTIRDKESPESE